MVPPRDSSGSALPWLSSARPPVSPRSLSPWSCLLWPLPAAPSWFLAGKHPQFPALEDSPAVPWGLTNSRMVLCLCVLPVCLERGFHVDGHRASALDSTAAWALAVLRAWSTAELLLLLTSGEKKIFPALSLSIE